MNADFEAAVAALRQPGGVIIYPTETLYGLGCRATDGEAALRISNLKGRGSGGLIVLVDEPPAEMPPLAKALAERFWPGPLTIVIPNLLGFPEEVCGPNGTIALRASPHPTVQAIVREVGPITSTSANLHGQPPIERPSSSPELRKMVDAAIDEGLLDASPPSTIVDGVTGRVFREGAGAAEVVEEIARALAT